VRKKKKGKKGKITVTTGDAAVSVGGGSTSLTGRKKKDALEEKGGRRSDEKSVLVSRTNSGELWHRPCFTKKDEERERHSIGEGRGGKRGRENTSLTSFSGIVRRKRKDGAAFVAGKKGKEKKTSWH